MATTCIWLRIGNPFVTDNGHLGFNAFSETNLSPVNDPVSSWHIFWTNQWLKASHFLLLIRIWSIVSVKIMMMIAKAHVWACKIRLEPVWCPRFACGLVLTFSFAHRHSSTSLSFYLENCLLHCLSFACSFQTFSMERVGSHHQHHSMLIRQGLFNSSASQSMVELSDDDDIITFLKGDKVTRKCSP